MSLPVVQVDAFTEKPFAGNPAAVCVLPEPRNAEWMQDVAREMNLSETAFLLRREDGFGLRWFTPEVEVDLCGHATLASAHVLWEDGHVAAGEEIRFHTRSGLLKAARDGAWILLDFPEKREHEATPPPGLLDALGVSSAYVGKNEFDFLVLVASDEIVRNAKPNFTQLANISARGVIVTSRSASPQYDFVSRFFAPGSGINEDPVTGSAHCCLGPFWAPRLEKHDFVAYQASARGGVVRVSLRGDRVLLSGHAVTVMRGTLLA